VSGTLGGVATADREHDDDGIDLEAAVTALFAGPSDEFVTGRDALVRALRAAGRADEIAGVKTLRKPKAVARALNAGAVADPGAVADLAAAIDAVSAAQSGGGDVRGALAALRDAERAVTDAAVAAVADEDRPPDASTLGAAVRAVLADPDALAALRAIRLVDVPAGGGLGLAGLGGAPAPAAPERTRAEAPPARTLRATAEPKRRGRQAPRAPAAKAAVSRPAGRPAGKAEPKALVTARRAVADAEEALRVADGALDEATGAVVAAESDEQAVRDAAAEAARQADIARDRALEVARVATAARREAAARTRRRDEAAAALAKAEARVAKLESP
jgi:hypothetical protein